MPAASKASKSSKFRATVLSAVFFREDKAVRVRWFAGFSLALLFSMSAKAVDLSALESMAARLTEPESAPVCSQPQLPGGLQAQDLPDDFDKCPTENQTELLAKGLYASTDGSIKALPYTPTVQATNLAVQLPQPLTEKAVAATGPFVIDLAQTGPATANQQSEAIQTALTTPSQAVSKPVEAPIKTGCTGLQTFAHRGSPGAPENSIQAVLAALAAGNSGAEIDAQQLRDGTWVVHHDLSPGRATHGPDKFVTSLVSPEWKQVYLKTRKGETTDTPAPFLKDMLDAFRQHAAPQQYLNIEIKGGARAYSCAALTQLDRDIRARMGKANFLYSARKIEDLRCLRAANPKVYLGLVIDPHPNTVSAELAAQTQGQTTKWSRKVRQDSAARDLYVKNSNRAYLQRQNFEDLDTLIGPYFGFHIDYKDYSQFAAAYSRNKNLRLMLYQLDDDHGLLSLLSHIKSQQKRPPPAVIIDSDPSFYCGVWNAHK